MPLSQNSRLAECPVSCPLQLAALSFPTAGSQGKSAELNFRLPELAHSPAGENGPIINIQSWCREVAEELQALA